MADDEILDDDDDDDDDDEYNIVAIVIALVVVLAIVGSIVWYFFIYTPPTEEEIALQTPKWEAPLEAKTDEVFELLPKMIINPLDSNGRYYLIVKVDVAWQTDMPSELIGELWMIPKAQNLIIDVFSSYTIAELQTPKFKEEARLELKYELNTMLGWEGEEPTPEEAALLDPDDLPPIREIYLVEFILQ
ncbi:MAG: flagellar basal body-associated FliL family protein [Candidatus Latescibacteria bacterium]|jgi:flagellar basal body-associated protein FliL|nr:flagellar basal body-associated FliL family protein [Candidatus Latescibacterota bacterium]